LPEPFHYLLEVVQITLPIVLNSSYEMAQTQLNAGADPVELTKALTSNFFSQLQRYMLDKIVETSIARITDALNAQIEEFVSGILFPNNRGEIILIIDRIVSRLKNEGITTDNFDDFLNDSIALLDALGVIEDEQKTAITVAWIAFNTAQVIRNGIQTASASGTLGSFVTGQKLLQGVFIELENPPQLVKDELSRLLGRDITTIDTVAAIDYLLASNIAEELIDRVPHLETVLNSIQVIMGGMTLGEILEAAFNTNFEESIPHNELYQRLKFLLKDFIDNLIQDRLIGELNKLAGKNDDVLRYVEEVVSPACKTLSFFVFSKLDAFIENGGSLDESFKNALSSIVMKIVSSNVLVVSDIIIKHTLEHTHLSLKQLAHDIGESPDNAMAIASYELFQPLVPKSFRDAITETENIRVACQELAKNLCLAAADITGPLVYTTDRITQISENCKTLFNALGPNPENPITDDVEAFFQVLSDCFYVPNLGAAKGMALLQIDIVKASLEILIPKVSSALALFGLKLTENTVAIIETEILAIFKDLDTLLKNLNKGLQKVKEEIEKAGEAYEAAIIKTTDSLNLISEVLKKDSTKDFFLNALKNIGKVRLDGDSVLTDNYLNACNFLAQALSLSLDVIAEFIKVNAQLFRKGADAKILVDNLLSFMPSTLPAELVLEDIKNAFIQLMDFLKPLIAAAIENKEAEIATERINADKKAEEEIRLQAKAKQEKRKKLPEYKNIEIEIISPVSFVNKKTQKALDWTYGKELPIIIKIKGADISMVTTSPKGVFVAINGHEHQIEFSKMRVDNTFLIYDTVFSTEFHPLTKGLNVIECTVVTPEKVYKKTVECLMNPDLASVCDVVFDMAQSMLDTGGDDHEYRDNECVAFTNLGNMPADMSEWIVSDRVNHHFIFPKDVLLLPHETLRVFTGNGVNTSNALYQLRKRAIWNNTEDIVLLINKNRVLVLNQKYKL
jgi:hypothetical protein